jgi:hypothetical protein
MPTPAASCVWKQSSFGGFRFRILTFNRDLRREQTLNPSHVHLPWSVALDASIREGRHSWPMPQKNHCQSPVFGSSTRTQCLRIEASSKLLRACVRRRN